MGRASGGGGTDQSATCHTYGDYITNVTFAGINKTTGTDGATLGRPDYGWHFDYGRTTPQITPGEVTIGQTYPISITVAVTALGDFVYQYLAVYIDWNQNNTLGTYSPMVLDNNENPIVWYDYDNGGTTQTLTGNITVPTGINPGSIYMRVMLRDDTGGVNGGNFTCNVGHGEMEDYVLNVSAASVAPTVTTQAVSSFTATTATGNGNITSLGSPNPTVSGICWNTATSPTTSNFKTTNGPTGVIGAFTGSITSLSANTTYYVRAYATNSAGTSYGSEVTFKTLTPGTWTGNGNNSYWTVANNWAGGVVPNSTTNVTIPSSGITFLPMIFPTDNAECNNLTVADGCLEIQSSASGTGSLIIHGTASGNVSTDVFLTAAQWHIVAPPVGGSDINSFIYNVGNGISAKVVNGTTNYAIADYNEGSNAWNSYFTNSTYGNFSSGKGYTMRLDADGYVSFYGPLVTGTKTVGLTKTGQGWNCVGNPYTSAIGMNASASSTENFLTKNSSIFDPNYACVYIWDGVSSTYKILGNLPSGLSSGRLLTQNYVQVGQAFFVKAKDASQTASFTPAMQSHQNNTNAPFKAPAITTSWPGIALNVASADASSSAIIAFNENMTKGLDPTYDAGLLRGTNGLSLYTRLVEDNGVDFAIQCLPESYSSLVIPLGLESKTGGEITFSAETVDLPAACKVILEDKATNTFTSLADGATYKTTVSAGATSVGRFYIHTGDNSTTGTSGQAAINNLKAYAANRAIIIEGEVGDKAIATLYNVQGLRVRVQSLQKGSLNTLPCPDLMNGIYLLTIQQDGETVTRKLIKK